MIVTKENKMSRSSQPKNQPRSCESYINTINDLRYKLTTTETKLEHIETLHNNEINFLRATILIALLAGFVIVVILSKGFSL